MSEKEVVVAQEVHVFGDTESALKELGTTCRVSSVLRVDSKIVVVVPEARVILDRWCSGSDDPESLLTAVTNLDAEVEVASFENGTSVRRVGGQWEVRDGEGERMGIFDHPIKAAMMVQANEHFDGNERNGTEQVRSMQGVMLESRKWM